MPVRAPGSDWDVNGCIASAGYRWCQILGKCLRAWEQSCDYPNNCLTWYDGCNTCSLVDGEDGMSLGACTEMMCFQKEMPYCMVPKPDAELASVTVEPWNRGVVGPAGIPVIDPMPLPINPFTAGHR